MNIGSRIRRCGICVYDQPFRHVTKADLKLAFDAAEYERVIAKWDVSTVKRETALEDTKGNMIAMDWLENQH